ncbi:MAG: transporter substrate-binding domain-containing protein [Clostridiales Family XIII bacterium]|jgi:ABC-type amino acid transport substrate-binding protein|nr:transporter substrate-binding domain-containing protein [Clostridiales Family XIII bacterium]
MGRTKKKILTALLAAAVLLAACESAPPAQGEDEYPVYTDYQDVPGVTADEIAAIESLREQTDAFVYGMNLTTESFYGETGEIMGYAKWFCAWLTELFGIPFEPAIYEWGDLIDGLESGEIDFTGELTATAERRETYFMTDAIAERSVKYMQVAGSEALSEITGKRPLRYAFLTGTTTADAVLGQSQDAVESFFIEDYDTAYAMLKSGEIDAFFDEDIAEAAFDVYGDVVAENFFPLVYGPVSLTAQDPSRKPVISVVQKILQNGGAHHLTELYNLGQREA